MRNSTDDARLNESDHWSRDRLADISLENVRAETSTAYVGVHESDSNDAQLFNANKRTSLQSDGSWREEQEAPTKERPKVVLSQNRATAFFHFILFHAIPVGGALALVWVNLKSRFYGPTVVGNWLSSLQFVAKAHELLMTLSIVTVMVAYLQHLLTGKRYVPFGAIFSAYQVTSISYLWSPELRGTLTAAGFPLALKVVFFCFVFISILLAAAVGPSSAIALQPRLVNFTTPGWTAALNVTSDILYPESIEEAGPPLDYTTPARNELSPAAGWQYLQELPFVGTAYNTEVGLQVDPNNGNSRSIMPSLYSVELLTSNPRGGYNTLSDTYRTLYIQYASNSTFATVQHVPVAIALYSASNQFSYYLKSGQRGIDTASIEMAQPYTSSVCQFNSILNGSDDRPLTFPTSYIIDGLCSRGGCYRDASVLVNHTTTRADIWSQVNNSTEGKIIWVDDPAPGVALGAVFVQPELCAGTNTTYRMAAACLVGARWANTTSQQQQKNNGINMVSPDAIQNVITSNSLITLPEWSKPPIKFSRVWAESLNPMTDVQNRTVVDSLLRWLPVNEVICPELINTMGIVSDTILTRAYMHERILSSLVANGLAHVVGVTELWEKLNLEGSTKTWASYNPSLFDYDELPEPPGMMLHFKGFLPGYAWSMDGTAIKIAIPVLLLYCLYALSYVAYTFITGRSSMTWRSLSELTTLAINSTPTPALKNTSAGIKEMATFQKLVGVREVEEHERLELIFDHDSDGVVAYRRVTAGRAY